MKIALITTGGTIASQRSAQTQLAAPALAGESLLTAASQFGELGSIEVIDAFRVPSPHVDPTHWRILHDLLQPLLRREDIQGVVISHGTACMEETAWFLDLVIQSEKPIVLTGAQRNASEPDTDGPRNLFQAIRVAQSAEACGMGVMIAFNERIQAAREVTKSQTLNVETFLSGDWGSLGLIRAGRVVFQRKPRRRLNVPLLNRDLPYVPIVTLYAGADGRMLDAAVSQGAKGVVIEALASGHSNASLQKSVESALSQGVAVVVSTRIPNGGTRIGYSFEGSSHQLVQAGAVLSDDLVPCKARILLMLALQREALSSASLQALFSQDQALEV